MLVPDLLRTGISLSRRGYSWRDSPSVSAVVISEDLTRVKDALFEFCCARRCISRKCQHLGPNTRLAEQLLPTEVGPIYL